MSLARTPKQIGEAIRRNRLRGGLNQTELGERAGLRQATVSMIENGHEAARLDTICALLGALNLEFEVKPRSRGSADEIESLF